MLIQFSFKNYKSFRDEAVLDLSATKINEFSDRVVNIGTERILRVAAIFGANASGKTAVFDALSFMHEYVANSLEFADDSKKFMSVKPTPFLLDSKTENGESEFEVYFTIPHDMSGKVYNYGFSIGKEGVAEEWLNTKAKTAKEYTSIFYRDKDGTLDLKKLNADDQRSIRRGLEKQVLIISLGARIKIKECKIVSDWFTSNKNADFGDPFSNYVLSRAMPEGFADDQKIRDRVADYFGAFDTQIKGFKLEKVGFDEETGTEKYHINALHKRIGTNKMVEIPFNYESAGTQKMFSLYQKLKDVLEKGSVFFVDELNARLHPLIVRNIILLFVDPDKNVNNAQLIFTSHDSWQMSNQFLRRDEIWFTTKDENGLSSLYSLSEVVDQDGNKIRKDENYEKNYMSGKYGAIPELSGVEKQLLKN